MTKERLKIANYLTKKWPARLVFFSKENSEGEKDENKFISPEIEKYKRVVFKSVVCMMLPVLSDIYKTWKLLFFSPKFSWLALWESWSRSGILPRPVGWHSALRRLHRHSFQPAALGDKLQKPVVQNWVTSWIAETVSCVMSMEIYIKMRRMVMEELM